MQNVVDMKEYLSSSATDQQLLLHYVRVVINSLLFTLTFFLQWCDIYIKPFLASTASASCIILFWADLHLSSGGWGPEVHGSSVPVHPHSLRFSSTTNSSGDHLYNLFIIVPNHFSKHVRIICVFGRYVFSIKSGKTVSVSLNLLL